MYIDFLSFFISVYYRETYIRLHEISIPRLSLASYIPFPVLIYLIISSKLVEKYIYVNISLLFLSAYPETFSSVYISFLFA